MGFRDATCTAACSGLFNVWLSAETWICGMWRSPFDAHVIVPGVRL